MIAVLSAPSNLGLRPPQPGSVPGTAKAPEALREAGLFRRLQTVASVDDAGCVVPGRYVDDDESRVGGRVRNQDALVDHARRLASRLGDLLDRGLTPLVVGGDCSLLLGIGLALAARGRRGLVHLDGHTDFRHPGNNSRCDSVAGEDLAMAVGLHWPAIANIDDHGPYFQPERTAHLGHRDDDEHIDEARSVLGTIVSARDAIRLGAGAAAETVRRAAGNSGYWLHIDVDILDPSVMPAVDSPDPGGLDATELVRLLTALAPGAVGASVTVFDPDLDPDGQYARLLVNVVVEGLTKLGSALESVPGYP